MSAPGENPLPLVEALCRLLVQRPELGLVTDNGGSLAPIADIAQPHGDALERWPADMATLAPAWMERGRPHRHHPD